MSNINTTNLESGDAYLAETQLATEVDASLAVFSNTRAWFVKAGQLPPTHNPEVRQMAFYMGMQFEELGEKLQALTGDTAATDYMATMGNILKSGEMDPFFALALKNPDTAKALLDADADLIWVTIGAGYAQGALLGQAYRAVSEANWAKFPGGVVSRHPDTGKVLKPEGWKAPNLFEYLHPSVRALDTGAAK